VEKKIEKVKGLEQLKNDAEHHAPLTGNGCAAENLSQDEPGQGARYREQAVEIEWVSFKFDASFRSTQTHIVTN